MTASIIKKLRLCSRFVAAITAVAFSAPAQDGTPQPAETADSTQLLENYRLFSDRLAAIVVQSVTENRSAKAAQSRIAEADAAVNAIVGQAPPRFEIVAMDAGLGSFPNPLRDQMRTEYSIEQMLMFPGKLSTMRRVQLKQKEMTVFEWHARQRDIVYKVKTLYYDLYLIDRLVAINCTSQGLMSDIIGIARVRYEAGTGMMPDILRAQTELATLKMKLVELDRRRQATTAMINALRATPMETVIDTLPEIRPPVVRLSLDTLKSVALENRPEVQAMRTNIGMKTEELTSTKLEWYPDFSIRTTYSDIRPILTTDAMSREFGTAAQPNPDRWSIMLGMTIPEVPWVLKKTKAQRLQARATLDGAKEELSEMINMTAAGLYRAFTDVQSNERRLQITTASVLPQAQLAFESTQSSYTTGGADFTMLLDAQRTLLMAHEEYHMIIMAYLASLAALEYASGVDVERAATGAGTYGSSKSTERTQ